LKDLKYVVPLIVIIALGIIADVYLYKTTYSQREDESLVPFPTKIGNVTVLKAYVGEKGLNKIKSIHWSPKALAGLKGGAVIIYSDGSITWISLLESTTLAKDLELKMVNKIIEYQGQLPYGAPIKHSYGNFTFYIIPDVRGKTHVLWREGRYLIWLEMGKEGTKVLNALSKFYWDRS